MLRRLVILFVVLASAVTMGTVAAGLGDDLKATCEDGHVWEEVSRVEATCTQDGTIVKQCAECGLEQTEVISKLGHEVEVDGDSYVAPTCTTEGYVGDVVCTRKDCDYAVEGETIPALGHSYGALVEKVDATCSATGMEAYAKQAEAEMNARPRGVLPTYTSSTVRNGGVADQFDFNLKDGRKSISSYIGTGYTKTAGQTERPLTGGYTPMREFRETAATSENNEVKDLGKNKINIPSFLTEKKSKE